MTRFLNQPDEPAQVRWRRGPRFRWGWTASGFPDGVGERGGVIMLRM